MLHHDERPSWKANFTAFVRCLQVAKLHDNFLAAVNPVSGVLQVPYTDASHPRCVPKHTGPGPRSSKLRSSPGVQCARMYESYTRHRLGKPKASSVVVQTRRLLTIFSDIVNFAFVGMPLPRTDRLQGLTKLAELQAGRCTAVPTAAIGCQRPIRRRTHLSRMPRERHQESSNVQENAERSNEQR